MTLGDENYGHSHLHTLYNIYNCLSEYKCNGGKKKKKKKLLQHHSKPQYRNDDVHMTAGLQIIMQRSHMHKYTYIHTNIQTCMHMHKYTHAYAHIYIYIHIHIYIYTYIYIYIYGHQYTDGIKNTQVIFDMPLSMWLCNITATRCRGVKIWSTCRMIKQQSMVI